MIKKYCKFVMLVATMIVMLAALSCKKNNVTKIKTDNKFAISLLADDTVTICDALNIIDSTWNNVIFTDENDVLYYVYVADTAKNVVSGEELLNDIEDINIDISEKIDIPEIEIPQEIYTIRDLIASGLPIAPFTYEYKLDTVLQLSDFPKLPFIIENFSILKAVMKGGMIDFTVDVEGINEDLAQCQITVMSSDIVDNEGIFKLTVNNHSSVVKNLADCIVLPENDSLDIQASLKIVTPTIVLNENTTLGEIDEYIQTIENIGGKHDVNLNGSISDIKLKSVEGIVNVPSIRYRGIVEDLDFDLGNVTGDLQINKPKTYVKYLNTFGFSVHADVDTMQLRTKEGEDMNILKTESVSFNLEESHSYKELDVTGEIVDYIDVLEDYESFTYSGDIKIIDEDAIGVYEDSHLDVATIMNLKLGMKINELMYCDTVDINMGDVTVQNYINEFEFKFNITNGMPIELEFQAYLMEDGVVTDSLFDETNNRIPSSYGGEPLHTTNIIKVPAERMDNVLNANKLIYNVKWTTAGREVVFKSTNMIIISVGVLTKTTEIDINNVM